MSSTGPVVALTDEELLALTDDHGVVVLPYAAGLEAAQRRVAVRAARRSLEARALIVNPQSGGAAVVSGGATAAATGLLGSMLQLRAAAPTVMVLHRLLGAAPEQEDSSVVRYLHVVGQTCVVEDVSRDGIHHLGLATSESWAKVLTEFVVPPDAWGDPDGAPLVGHDPAAADTLLAALGHPTVLLDLAVVSAAPDDPPPWLLALGPHGCWCTRDQGRRYVSRYPAQLVGDAVNLLRRRNEAVHARLDASRAVPTGEGVTMTR